MRAAAMHIKKRRAKMAVIAEATEVFLPAPLIGAGEVAAT